jgi:hypothetical protein
VQEPSEVAAKKETAEESSIQHTQSAEEKPKAKREKSRGREMIYKPKGAAAAEGEAKPEQ